MGRFFPVVGLLLTLAFWSACITKSSSSLQPVKKFSPTTHTAWNEDSLCLVVIDFYNGNRFRYAVSDTLNGRFQYYYGEFTRRNDTIHLQYRRGRKPLLFASYVLVEHTGGFLFQPYDLNRRITLRFTKMPGRH